MPSAWESASTITEQPTALFSGIVKSWVGNGITTAVSILALHDLCSGEPWSLPEASLLSMPNLNGFLRTFFAKPLFEIGQGNSECI